MKLKEAVELVNKLHPNQYDYDVKVGWLSKVDGRIFSEVISTHDGFDPEVPFAGYTADTDPETVLLVPEPYAEDVYLYYLQSMIDRENGEIAKYNQSGVMFNDAYQRFSAWYNRTHRSLPMHQHFRF